MLDIKAFWKNLKLDWEKAILILYIFFIPIMINNPYRSIFPTRFGAKMQLTEFIFPFLLIVLLIKLVRKKISIVRTPLDIPVILYFGSAFVSTAATGFKFNSISQLSITFYVCILYFVLTNALRNSETISLALKAWLAAAVVAAGVGMIALLLFVAFGITIPSVSYTTYGFPYLDKIFRITSTLAPTTKMLSSYLTITTGTILGLLLSKCSRKFKHFLIVLFILIVIVYPFTISRGVLGLAITITFFLFLARNKLARIARWVGVLFVLLLFIVINIVSIWYFTSIQLNYSYDPSAYDPNAYLTKSSYFYFSPQKGVKNINLNIKYTYDAYFWLKKSAIEIFKRYPLFGCGLGGYSSATEQLELEGKMPRGLNLYQDAQSTPLHAMAERGLVGILSLLLLWGFFIKEIVTVIRKTNNHYWRNLLWGCLASSVGIFIDGIIHLSIMNFRFVWLLFAFTMAICKVVKSKQVELQAQNS